MSEVLDRSTPAPVTIHTTFENYCGDTELSIILRSIVHHLHRVEDLRIQHWTENASRLMIHYFDSYAHQPTLLRTCGLRAGTSRVTYNNPPNAPLFFITPLSVA